MTPEDPATRRRDPDLEDALDDRWSREDGPLSRSLFFVVLATLGLVGVARLTGRMELVNANIDLIAAICGFAGLVWTTQSARRGVTRFGHQGHWEVRREEHPVFFWILIVVYTTGFVGATAAGLLHRIGG